jgi:hypothetical protein
MRLLILVLSLSNPGLAFGATAGGCEAEGKAFSSSTTTQRKTSEFANLARCLRSSSDLPNAGYHVLRDAYDSESDEFLRRSELIELTQLKVCGQGELSLYKNLILGTQSDTYKAFALGGISFCRSAAGSLASELLQLFDTAPNPNLRKQIIYTLGSIDNRAESVTGRLARIAASDADGPTRRAAGDILLRWRMKADRSLLDQALTNPLDDEGNMARLVDIVRATNTWTQEDAFSIADHAKYLDGDRELALRTLANPVSMSKLKARYLKLLDDPNPALRDVASYALGNAGEKSAASAILRNLKSITPGKWGEKMTTPPDWVRLEININALSNLKDCRWVPEVISYPVTAPGWPMTMAPCKTQAKGVLMQAMKSENKDLSNAATRTFNALFEQ